MTQSIEAKVTQVDMKTLQATAVDPTEIDDVVSYVIFLPAHFGGVYAPYPKVGETLMLVYNKQTRQITNAWHPRQQVSA